MKQMLSRLCAMLDNEGVAYEKSVIAELIKKNAPDFRRTIQEIQRYAIQSGTENPRIDTGILSSSKTGLDLDIKNLLDGIKDKDFKSVRKWVTDHSDIDPNDIFRRLYESCLTSNKEGSFIIKGHSIPQLVLILADYQHRSAFVVDQEINTMAALVECMAKLEWN
jgi:replication factor C small subunit